MTLVVDSDASAAPLDAGIDCGQATVPIEPLPPDILIIQDRSLSMTWDVDGNACAGGTVTGDGKCGTISRWYQTITAIKDVVQATQSTVNWGLFYLGNEATSCAVNPTPDVPITPNASFDPIQASLDGVQFTGQAGTPTAAAVNNALAYMKTLTDPNPKFLLLATDGEPNCGSGMLATTDTAGSQRAVAAAKSAGIPTFVVGIATTKSDAATQALNAMAVAGGQPQTGAATQYYAVSDTEGLKTTLNAILALTLPCTISLEDAPKGDWAVAIGATEGSTGDKIEVMADAQDGWSYTDSSKSAIQLNGEACSKLKNGDYSDFGFVYTCPGQVPHVN